MNSQENFEIELPLMPGEIDPKARKRHSNEKTHKTHPKGHAEIASFSELNVRPEISNALLRLGFDKPFPIQAKGSLPAIEGNDLIAQAQTGTGKTLVFGIAILEQFSGEDGIFALVIVPTRELAVQVSEEIVKFSTNPPRVVPVYGGVSIENQIDRLRRATVVVGTPGRILDHISRGTIDFSRVKILVLDEVDRMLDMGFIEDIEQIVSRLPRERQTMFFSATIPDRIKRLSERFLKREKVEVSAGGPPAAEKVAQFYSDTEEYNKPAKLLKILTTRRTPGLTIIFTRTKIKAHLVGSFLKKNGIISESTHGDLSQSKRERVMSSFKEGELAVLVATDVAARGLDIEGVSRVINYDFPDDLDTYIHRIGRTARAGAEGEAITFIVKDNHLAFRKLMSVLDGKIAKLEIPVLLGEEKRLGRFEGSRPRGRFRYSQGGSGRRGPPIGRGGGKSRNRRQ